MSHAALVAQRSTAIRNSLNMGDKSAALRVLVQDPLYNCQDQKLRTEDIKNVVSALAQFKGEAQIDQALGGISDEEVDILMKYVHAALAFADNSKELLVWHASILKRAGGLAPIVRVLSDKANRI